MSNIRNMIDSARSGNAVEFQKAFATEVQDRLGTALAEKRAEVVSNMFRLGEETAADDTVEE